MPYIIDGHNLIPYIPSLDLADPEDENSLIEILQHYTRRRRSRIEVYFDQATAGRDRKQTHGLVQAHFVRANSTADQAIKSRLARLGKAAKNWTVVSSDREVQAEARDFHCQVLTSSEFAGMLQSAGELRETAEDEKDQPEISPGDIDYWMDQFGRE